MGSWFWQPEGTPLATFVRGTLHTRADATRLRGRIPEAWIEALGHDAQRRVRSLWSGTEAALPQFHRYMDLQLEDVAIGEGSTGPLLLYLFRDFAEGAEGHVPGVFAAAPPPAVDAVETFERAHGELPSSLRALWSRHDFAFLKNGMVLASLVVPDEALGHGPRLFNTADAEYLAFADVRNELMTCLVRAPGARVWEDRVLLLYRDDLSTQHCVSQTVDDLLVDWPLERWPARGDGRT